MACSSEDTEFKIATKNTEKSNIPSCEEDIIGASKEIKSSQEPLTLKVEKLKMSRRSRDMEYLAPSLKESIEFDSCSYNSHIFVEDMPYPAEYYVRRTRSMKWRQWSEKTLNAFQTCKDKDSENVHDITTNKDSPVVISDQSIVSRDNSLISQSDKSRVVLTDSSQGMKLSTRTQTNKHLHSANKLQTDILSSSEDFFQSVSESAVQHGKRRSKLSRRKVKSCDNSPLDFNKNNFKRTTRTSIKTINYSCVEMDAKYSSSQSCSQRSILLKFPNKVPKKFNTDFFLPDKDFVHLKVAKVRKTPVSVRQSSRLLDKKNNRKVLDLESDGNQEYVTTNRDVKSVFTKEEKYSPTDNSFYRDYSIPISKPENTEKSMEETHSSKSINLLCSEGSSALVFETPSIFSATDVNSEPLISSDSDTTLQEEKPSERLCSDVEKSFNIDTVNIVEEKPLLENALNQDNSERSVQKLDGGVSNISKRDVGIDEKQLEKKQLFEEPINDLRQNNTSEHENESAPVAEHLDVSNNPIDVDPKNMDLEQDRQKTPVELLITDSIGSNVAQESPFSGVATGTPPQPAKIPDAQAHDKADLLELPIQFNGCLSHNVDGKMICFDVINCPQHDTVASIVGVCFKRSLVVWSESVEDGCWVVDGTVHLPMVESFDNLCLFHTAENIWLVVSGNFASSSLRLFYLNLNGSRQLQEHLTMASDTLTEGCMASICSVVDKGFACSIYNYQKEVSTLVHIALDAHFNSPPDIVELGEYSGNITSICEVRGTQNWIVGLSKDEIILGNLKFGQIVKCISWSSPFLEAPDCIHVSTEGGLLFLLICCPSNRKCIKLNVVNPETGRMSTLVEYTNENKPFSRYSGAATADTQHIAAQFQDGSVNVWNIFTGQVVAEIDHLAEMLENENLANKLDGDHLFYVAENEHLGRRCTVKLLDTKTDRSLLFVGMLNCVHIHEL
ncbi:uncharacterized protein [Antedon mediterranea]|uniref:uncharacterized protein isoform X2 n=1 Tax=Antedon mediterranea TaxID=105859 RepID=UPI003AF95138